MDVVAALSVAHIDYAVIGALAVSVHGVVRASQDADAIVRATIGELGEMNARLQALGLKTELRHGDIDDPVPALLLASDKFGNRVDLLVGLKGMDPSVYARAVQVKMSGRVEPLRVVCREDLIAMKAFAGGPQDLLDAKRCIAVAGIDLDISLLRRAVAGYGHDAIANCEKLLTDSNKTSGRF